MVGVQAELTGVLDALGLTGAPSTTLDVVRRVLATHGDLEAGLRIVERLRDMRRESVVLDTPAPRAVLSPSALGQSELERTLLDLSPWRKGPVTLSFGDGAPLLVDAEWRSDAKWQRVLDLGPALAGRRVLDVGTGNGYFLLRLRGAGAHSATGLEPSLRSVLQFLALSRLFACDGCALWPLRLEDFPQPAEPFDTVLSMGVLYHQRDPLQHLRQLRALLAPGGQLVLESIVVLGQDSLTIAPGERYAGMRNVYTLPSVTSLHSWLNEAGFEVLRVGAPTLVTSAEQRSTRFCPGPSLDDFLEPPDAEPDAPARRTREGHPRPWRQIVLARACGGTA